MEQRHGAAAAPSASPAERRGAGAVQQEAMSYSQAPAPRLRGFSCAFTRRNCTHDALFSHQYMRCFPHCCPQHVSRSYCGASVYLQVDLDEYSTMATRSDDAGINKSDNLHVFGRFRLQEARGLTAGERISLDAVMSSLLSESNPTGEWVASRMIASAGHNAWLVEINPSAKWFYDWEVGAVRDRRAMPHVFEAYVFVLWEEKDTQRTRTPNLQMASTAVPPFNTSVVPSTDRNYLEVVTFAISSPFTLSSFRRAPSSRRRSHHATTELSSGEERAVEANGLSRRDRSAPEGDTDAFNGDEGGLDVDGDADRVEDTQEEEEETSKPNLSELFGDADFDHHPKIIPFREELDFDMETDERDSEPTTPQSHVASAARNTVLVNWFLLQIPLRAAQPFMEMVEQYLSTALWKQLRSSFLGGTSQPSTRLLLPPDTLGFSAFASRLLGSPHSSPAVPESTDAATDNEPVVKTNEQLIELSLKLILWMFFDRDNNAQMEAFLQRSAKVLLDRVALYKSYEAWTEWLQERIDEYLFSQGWSLARLVAKIEDILKAGETSAFFSGSVAFAVMTRGLLVDAFFATDAHVPAGYKTFVAQAREHYIAAVPLFPLAQFARQSRAAQAASGSSSFETGDRLSQLTGLWLCDWNAASCRDIAFESAQTARQEPIGITSLLWMWKQLGCIRMAFSTENGVSALLIGSLFNPSLSSSTAATEERVTRIVLDQQHHWFGCFPGGESSIGVRIGGQSFGDYVASVSGDESEDHGALVDIKCYSWPSRHASSLWPSLSPPPPSSSTTEPTAFCWRWQLSPRTDHQGPSISVNITISSSQFDVRKAEQGTSDRFRSSASSIERLETESLSAKLALVRHWTPIYELEIPYRRLESY